MMAALGIGAFLLMLLTYAVLYRRVRRRKVGAAAVGTVYDLLQQDRQRAVEIIVEEKAEVSDPETRDGKPSQ